MKAPPWLAHLRTDRRGIPVPYINNWGPEDPARYVIKDDYYVQSKPALWLDDRGQTEPDFFRQNMQRQRRIAVEGLCQVCARPVPWSRRFLVVSSISTEVVQVARHGECVVIMEPWLDERCGTFALEKCPGLIRRHSAADLHLLPITSKSQCKLVASQGWVEGPLEEESKRVLPYMWVKIYVPAAHITVVRQKAAT